MAQWYKYITPLEGLNQILVCFIDGLKIIFWGTLLGLSRMGE